MIKKYLKQVFIITLLFLSFRNSYGISEEPGSSINLENLLQETLKEEGYIPIPFITQWTKILTSNYQQLLIAPKKIIRIYNKEIQTLSNTLKELLISMYNSGYFHQSSAQILLNIVTELTELMEYHSILRVTHIYEIFSKLAKLLVHERQVSLRRTVGIEFKVPIHTKLITNFIATVLLDFMHYIEKKGKIKFNFSVNERDWALGCLILQYGIINEDTNAIKFFLCHINDLSTWYTRPIPIKAIPKKTITQLVNEAHVPNIANFLKKYAEKIYFICQNNITKKINKVLAKQIANQTVLIPDISDIVSQYSGFPETDLYKLSNSEIDEIIKLNNMFFDKKFEEEEKEKAEDIGYIKTLFE